MDTFCQSYRQQCAGEVGVAAAHAEEEKVKKYPHLDRRYLFQPVALETTGVVGPDSMPFMKELGVQIRRVTGEARSFVFLMQRIIVAVQMGNAISVLGTLEFSDLSNEGWE